MPTSIVVPSPVLAEVPTSGKANVGGKHFGRVWEAFVTTLYPGVPDDQCPHGYVHCLRTRDGDWAAEIPVERYLRRGTSQRDPERKARIEAIKEALRANGFVTGPDMIGGRGRTREAAAEAAAAGVAAAYFLAKGHDGAAWLAERRAAEAERRRVREAEERAAAEHKRAQNEAERTAKARADLVGELVREAIQLEDGGLLEGSNTLAGLRDIVLRLKAQPAPHEHPGGTVSHSDGDPA